MKIYLLSQNIERDYDTFDSVVVAAENENEARLIHPCDSVTHVKEGKWMGTFTMGPRKGQEYENEVYSWVDFADIDKISIKYIGEASPELKKGVILASFNAG